MSLGKYYEANQKRADNLAEEDWRVAIVKCKEHLRWKLRQKTLYGAHSPTNLGADPIDFYLSLAYEKLLSGEWEWQVQYSLVEKLIRIIDCAFSTEVEKKRTQKSEKFKVEYRDLEAEFYDLGNFSDQGTLEEAREYEQRVKKVEEAVKGDPQLELFWEAVQAGFKRSDVAEFLEITPKQLDKVKEKLIRRVSTSQPLKE